MRIGLVIWALHSKGGLERVGTKLAWAMHERGHEVAIFYQDLDQSTQQAYPLPPDLAQVNLKLRDGASLSAARQKLLAIRPDVLCAMFSWDALLWFPALLNGTGIPLLISEHNVPRIIEEERWNRYERLACMAGADAIHLLSSAFLDSLPPFLRERAVVIPNPAEAPVAVDQSRENAPRKRLLAVGRLQDEHKQFSLILQAVALLAPTFPDWDLRICGDGQDRQRYESMIAALGLAGRVSLLGRVEDMDAEYAAAHLFCIPSRYEGFGLVVVEAQRFGLPVVGFAECNGVNEIVMHGENGILAPEMNARCLAASLKPLLTSASLRQQMGVRGQASLARFEPQKIYAQWEEILHKTAQAKGNTRLNFAEQSAEEATLTSLREILHRRHPFVRPACAAAEREKRALAATLTQAIELLRRHNSIV